MGQSGVCKVIAAATLLSMSAVQLASADDALETTKGNVRTYIGELSPEVVEGACREGSVMLYSLIFRGNLESFAEKFRARFPCLSMKTFAASGGVLAQRFISETQGGNHVADIWMNSSPVFGDDLAERKMLLDWTPPNAANVPENWKHEGAWYAVGLAHIGVAWNTQEVTPEQAAWLDRLKSWDQLAGAPFSGATGMVDIRAGGTTQLPYFFFDQQYGGDFWSKLSRLKPVIFNGINPLAERLSVGEFAFAPVVTADTAIATQWLKGAPVRWKYPEPGIAVPYFIGISTNAPHPNAAKLFTAWSLSKDGEAAWVNATGLAPAVPGVDDQRKYAKESWYRLPTSYYHVDWKAISGAFKAQTAKFAAVFGR